MTDHDAEARAIVARLAAMEVECPECKGEVLADNAGLVLCPQCHGSGKVALFPKIREQLEAWMSFNGYPIAEMAMLARERVAEAGWRVQMKYTEIGVEVACWTPVPMPYQSASSDAPTETLATFRAVEAWAQAVTGGKKE